MSLLRDVTTNRRKLAFAVLLVLLLAGFVRFYHIGWSFSNNAIDEGIMLERSLMVNKGYDVYSELPVDQSPLGFIVGGLLWGDVVTLRIFSATMSLLALAACMEMARRIRGNFAMLVTGLLIALDFAFLRESRTFSLNGISASLLAISALFFVIYVQKSDRAALVASGLLIGVSASMKLFGVLGFIGMLAFMSVELMRDGKGRARRFGDTVLLAVSAAMPVCVLLLALGPSQMIQGMLFDQGHREYQLYVKLGMLAYFGTNLAYLLPLAYARTLWKSGPEERFLVCASVAVIGFMVLQPLTFYGHMVIATPLLAPLAGIFLSGLIDDEKDSQNVVSRKFDAKKWLTFRSAALALLCVGLLVSAGLAAYGLAVQGKPAQEVYSEKLHAFTGPGDWVICGDPIVAAYAERQTPPSVVNVAFRMYPELTLSALESAVLDYNVSVVVLAYRLNSMEGFEEFLQQHNYSMIARDFIGHGAEPAINVFEPPLEPTTFYVRNDIVQRLGLPTEH